MNAKIISAILLIGLGMPIFAEISGPSAPPNSLAQGYLDRAEYPDSVALVPMAPAQGTARQDIDEAFSTDTLTLQNTARFEQAQKDADLTFPQAGLNFSCALGIEISQAKTPAIYKVLIRTLTDAGLSTYEAKEKYQRHRPFMWNRAPVCTPEQIDKLRADGSYPSGHTAIGWAWALVLTEIAPDQANELLERGKDFGESRMICNVHWRQDVLAGRMMGAATVAILHSKEEFLSELETARTEYQTATKAVAYGCAAEAEALEIEIPAPVGD